MVLDSGVGLCPPWDQFMAATSASATGPNEGAIEGRSQPALFSPDGQISAAVASHST
jgi:hypothetical protein